MAEESLEVLESHGPQVDVVLGLQVLTPRFVNLAARDSQQMG